MEWGTGRRRGDQGWEGCGFCSAPFPRLDPTACVHVDLQHGIHVYRFVSWTLTPGKMFSYSKVNNAICFSAPTLKGDRKIKAAPQAKAAEVQQVPH